MALVLADRVQETSTSPGGTGTLNLSGTAPAGFKTFSSGIGTGNSTYYCIFDTTAYDWEVGIGTYTSGSPGTLSRTTVLSNSAGTTSAINFTNGNTLNIFVTYPSEKSINYDANGVATIGSTLGYSDTGIIASFASTESTYNQVVIQNKSTANTASTNFNVSNDAATGADNYAEFGINSSTFAGDSSFDLPGAAYLSSASTPLTIGTYAAYPIHFITNGDSTTTDAMTINEDGSVSLGGLPSSGIGNIACNNINLKFQQITTSAGTTILTNASPYFTQFVGTNTHTVQLPDATTCLQGITFVLDNDSTQNVTIKDGSGTSFELLIPGGIHSLVLESPATVAGTWLIYSSIPSTVEWGTNSLSLGSTVISGGTWQGGTVQVGYGGTGLTSLTSGGALYATSSSTMSSGTLPVTAGGTGQTSFSSGYIPYGNSSAALQSSASLQFNGTYLVVGGTTPLSGATNPISAFSSTANNYVQTYTYNASNGASASADFVAYGDNSTDAHGWADMGFTSSNYADAVYTVTGPNEAYLFGSAPSGAGDTGNLVYATDSTGSANAHQWYVGGFTQAKGAWKMQLTSTGLQLANALSTAYGGTGLTTVGTNGQVLTSNGTTLTWATPTTGTVTSVTGTSPVVSSGGNTPAISLASGYGDTQNPYASKTANYVLAAPNGSAGAPTFRALVAADIPALSYAPTTGSTSITTLGTIGTGTWQGTSISTTYADAKVTAVNAGTGVSVNATTGAVTVTNTGVTSATASTGISVSASTGGVTFTNTGVTSATAGSGISVSASTGGVTFTNTGVTSATASTGISVSGSTGGVTFTNTGVTSLTAGTGMSVSASTGGVTINATGATLNSQAGAYVLVASDAGKIVSNTTGGITVNNSVFSAGNIVTIYNNSASSQTITQGTGVTLQWAGQSASTTGNRTLGLYGIATIVFLSASSAVITGSGLT